MNALTLLAFALDFSKINVDSLLEKGIAVFFAVYLLMVFGRRLKALESATNRQTQAFQQALNAQTVMLHDCIVWLGELVRHEKKIGPPTSPGLGHIHRRADDTPPPGNGTPAPSPPPAPSSQGDHA